MLRAAGLAGVVRILVKRCNRPLLRRVGRLKSSLRSVVLGLGAIEFAGQRGDGIARLRHRLAQPLAVVHGPQARIVRFRNPFPAHHVVLAADHAGLVNLLLGESHHVAHLAELVEPEPELAHIRGPCLDQVVAQRHAQIVHALELQRALEGISERLRVRAIARRRQVFDQQAPGEVFPVRGEHGGADRACLSARIGRLCLESFPRQYLRATAPLLQERGAVDGHAGQDEQPLDDDFRTVRARRQRDARGDDLA